MYISDGIVYGKNSEQPIRISSVKVLPDMIMLITFSNGEVRLFDAAVLDGEAFAPLKDENIFSNPAVDHGVITWKNGEIDCAPEFMYEHSYEYMEPKTTN